MPRKRRNLFPTTKRANIRCQSIQEEGYPFMLRSSCTVLLLLFCLLILSATAKAQGNAAAASRADKGKVSICNEIDDDWKCVDESNQWVANKPFNVLFLNRQLVFHRASLLQTGLERQGCRVYKRVPAEHRPANRKYATVGDELKLPLAPTASISSRWANARR